MMLFDSLFFSWSFPNCQQTTVDELSDCFNHVLCELLCNVRRIHVRFCVPCEQCWLIVARLLTAVKTIDTIAFETCPLCVDDIIQMASKHLDLNTCMAVVDNMLRKHIRTSLMSNAMGRSCDWMLMSCSRNVVASFCARSESD